MNFLEEKNLLADKGYDSDLFRKSLRNGNREPIIPGRKNRKKLFTIRESTQEDMMSWVRATNIF